MQFGSLFGETLRNINMLSVFVRLLLAVLCGGAIGIEREFKRRPAGFRTHILICLGAAITTLTSQYLFLVMHQFTDIARLGAQAVAGIGFIGAGTIIVTRRQSVKGLTTAAGLWVSAIVGLCLGAGFYEGGIAATILVLAAEVLVIRLEYRVLEHAPEMNLYVEYDERECLDRMLQLFREKSIKVLNFEVTRSAEESGHHSCVILSLRLSRGISATEFLNAIRMVQGILLVEEL